MISLSRTMKYSSTLAEELASMREEKLLMDFTIQLQEESVPCHKLILAINSPVLKSMLICGMAEAAQEAVTLENISVETMNIILDYMYCGNVTLNRNQLMDIISACDYLQITELKEMCVSEAPSVIVRANVISWWRLAGKMNLDNIKGQCEEMITGDFYKVSRQENFVSLTHGELQHYINDITSDTIQSDDILDATMRWVNHDAENRQMHLQDLLQQLQLNKCSVLFIKTVIKSYDKLLGQTPNVYKLLIDALVTISTKLMMATPQVMTRVLVLIGGREDEISRVCWKLHQSNQVERLCDMPYRLRQHSVCKTPLGFAVTGGELCLMFIAVTQTWARMKNLPSKRTAHGSICISGILMVVGGWQDMNNSTSLQMMTIEEGTWEAGPDMPKATRFPKVAEIDENMYVLNEMTKELVHLDVANKVWSQKTSLPVEDCCGASMTSARGRLYVGGGKDRIFAWYDPGTDAWCMGQQPRQQHIYGSLVYHDDKLLLLGGSYKNGTDEVEEYSVEDGAWSVCSYRMPASLYIHHCLVLGIPQ